MDNADKLEQVSGLLRDLADEVEDGECSDPNNGLFDADAFWTAFNEEVKPYIKSIKNMEKMD